MKGRVRKQPQRTCIACQQVLAKRALVRIVRTPTGTTIIDPTGKAAGRGAYLCAKRRCWMVALEQRRLEYALKITLSPEERASLEEYAAQLSDELAEDASP